ncbi:MAG TPA: hypothetical protein VFM97_00425 [Gammaproteobacteria bacterium]|nr:hypothetical protein [Gammaproteobacteria bacterium]
MAIQDTSLLAYQTLYRSGRGPTTALKILKAMKPGRKYTQAQLEQLTGMRANSVSGRLNELVDRKFVHREVEQTRCPITKALVHRVYRPRAIRAKVKVAA